MNKETFINRIDDETDVSYDTYTYYVKRPKKLEFIEETDFTSLNIVLLFVMILLLIFG